MDQCTPATPPQAGASARMVSSIEDQIQGDAYWSAGGTAIFMRIETNQAGCGGSELAKSVLASLGVCQLAVSAR
jgi:hypothetical protein